MQPEPATERSHTRDRAHVLALWALVAAAGPSADIVCYALAGVVPAWFSWARIGVMGLVYLLGTYSESARRLRTFCAVYSVTVAATTTLAAVRGAGIEELLHRGFVPQMLRIELQGVALVFVVLAIVWSIRGRRDRVYFRMGELAAPVGLGWIGGGARPLRWRLAGPVVGLVSGIGIWVFIRLAGAPASHSRDMIVWAVAFAFMNAFVEEVVNRNALLAALERFPAHQRILVSAAIFGINHWNGLPYGVAGVLMTSILGYVAAKAMVETKGMFWSWFMHMVPDCVVFYYWGIGSVQHR